MTELEFEKACRGTRAAVPDEYAWGDASVVAGSYTLFNSGDSDEILLNPARGVGNAIYLDSFIDRPVRCGAVAASIFIPTRQETGATFFGVMEMSGNLWEPVVTVGNAEGRAFTGAHGDGILDAVGDGNVQSWPAVSGVGAGIGLGTRGGCFGQPDLLLRVSERATSPSIVFLPTDRSALNGARLVRSHQ